MSLHLLEVTDAQLARYADLIYRQTGIVVSPKKRTLLSNRLRRRLRETGIDDFDVYYNHLRRLTASHPEWDAFLEEITTHETYLFRDEVHWNWFRRKYLPERIGRTIGGKVLRIWSAACSCGDEPTTIACCVAEALPNPTQWRVRILGTDIGIGALAQAKQATFGERSMRLVPDEMRRRYFSFDASTSSWRAKPVLTTMFEFRQHNLLEALDQPPFDVVFLKNVLIYFDAGSKARVLQHVRDRVRPGGLLVAGGAEGVGDLLREFERIEPWLFRRPETQGGNR